MNLKEEIENAINKIWGKYYMEKGIRNGDISPGQHIKYLKLIHEMELLIQETADLIQEVAEDNYV